MTIIKKNDATPEEGFVLTATIYSGENTYYLFYNLNVDEEEKYVDNVGVISTLSERNFDFSNIKTLYVIQGQVNENEGVIQPNSVIFFERFEEEEVNRDEGGAF
jgi:hypothetical protein